jgi:nitrite reductase/ring-hydroxylating ferredoxin subunit/uncharacterized membrane protein
MARRGQALARYVAPVVHRVERATELDGVAGNLSGKISRVRSARMTDLLSGTWLGHPLHPLLTDLPIGCWTSAWLLDLVGGRSRHEAARTLVGIGVVTAVPTAAAGLSDWADTVGEDRRVGLVHAAGNTAGLVCFALSWWARKRGHRGSGVILGMVGATATTAAAYLGGHLVYRAGIGVDVNAFTEPLDDWVELADGGSAASEAGFFAAKAGDVELLVTRAQDAWQTCWQAIGDRCSHRGGPLHEGMIDAGCVTCPWHASQFRTDTGAVVRGPATSPQPSYEVRKGTHGLEARGADRTEVDDDGR